MFKKTISAIRAKASDVSKEEIKKIANDIKDDVIQDTATYLPLMLLCGRLLGATVAMKTYARPEMPAPKIIYKMYGATHIHP